MISKDDSVVSNDNRLTTKFQSQESIQDDVHSFRTRSGLLPKSETEVGKRKLDGEKFYYFSMNYNNKIKNWYCTSTRHSPLSLTASFSSKKVLTWMNPLNISWGAAGLIKSENYESRKTSWWTSPTDSVKFSDLWTQGLPQNRMFLISWKMRGKNKISEKFNDQNNSKRLTW